MMQTDCGRNEKKWGHSSRRLNLRGVSPFFLTYLYKSPYKLIISIITLWAFLFNIFGYELAWAHNSSGTVLPTVSTGAQNRPGHFILPTSLGEIKEIYHHPSFDSAANGGLAQDELPFSKKMVIHIQDAHCNYSAQKSINEIVKYLNKNYGIELVGLEGGEGNYDLSVFTRIKDLNLRKKVADYFLKEGRINGAEYYAILNPDKVTLKGVENSKLYIKNLNIYKEHLKDKPKIDQALNTLSKHITKQKQKIYSKKLLELDQKSNQYHNNEIDLKEYLNYLTIGDSAQKKWGHKNGDSLLCGATKQTVPIFSNLSSLIEIIEEEGNINFKRCKSERQDLIRDIKPIISKLELENLLKYSLNFKNGLMKEDQFYLYLLEKAESCDIDINKYYPNLVRFSKFLRKYESLDKYKVFEELKNFEETLFKKLAENDKQIKLYNTSKDLDIVEKFFNVRLTRPEYDYYRENDPILSLRGKNGDTLLLEQGVPIFSEAISKILTKHQKTFEKFYSYSLKRDNAFIKNLESIGQTHGSAPTTVLITGGFHTENLKELFKKHGYSYIVILPKFDPNEETPYFRLLSGGLSPVEEAIRAKTSGLAMYSTLNHIWEMINRKDADNFHLAVNEVALQGGLYSAPTGEIDSIRASPSEEKSEKKETQALSDNETKSLPKTPLWRRMLQFRLRTLFILTTIIALVIGTFIYRYGRKVEFFMGGKAREHVEKEVLDSPNLKVLREARKQSEYREKDFEYLKQEEWQFQEELDVEIFPKLAKVDLLNNKTWDIKEADIESINWRVQAGWMVLQEGIVEIKLKDGREILYATRDNQKEPIKLIKAPNEGKVDMFKRCLSETESILQNVKKENIDWYPDEYGEAIRIVRTYGCYASGGLATDELINVLNDKSKIPEFRADSARLLSYLGLSAKPAIPDLIKALKNDENSSVRFQASDALASLLYHLKRDLDPETKNEMTEALKTAIKNDSELLREIEENHPNMTNIGSFIDDIKDEEEDQKSAPSRKISPSEPTRSSPLKVKLNEGNKMRDRAVAEIPEDEMIDVKTGGVIKGEIATSTIYSYAEPCILVLIFDRSINKTYYVHSRLLELDNVFEIINAAFDNIGNGPNVDVVFGGGSLNSKVGLRYNQMVWKRRQKVAEYLKKKGYSTDKCFYPKYSNMAADFYFDRKTTNVIIDFVNTGEEIRNEELMKRLQEVNDAKSTVITKPPSEPARSSASTLQAGIHTLAGEVLEVAIVESPVSKIAESIIGRTIDFVRRKKLTSKDLSDIVWALRENELPRTENGSLRLISDDEIMYILEQLNDRLIDIDFPLGSVISSYLKPPDPLVHLRPQIVDKEPRIWLSLSSLNRLIENLPTFFKTADIEKDEFPVLLARDAITAGEFLCYIGFITGQTIDSASVYQPGLHNHAILSDYVSDRGIEIVQEITEKAKAKAIQKLQFHEEKIPAKKGDPFYDNFHPAIFEEMAKSFKEFMVREWENSPELLKEAKALYEQCKRNGITQRKNLVLLDLAATGKTLLYVKAVLEYFSEKEGLDLRNIRVFVGYSHDRKLCLPEIRLFDKQFNTEGRPFKDQMWPFYRVANGSHNGEVLFKFHKDRTKVLIHVYRSLMLYNTALSASRASAAQAQELGAEEELAEKTGIIKQDGLPYVKIRVTKKVKLNSINIGIAKIAISIDIPGSSELALSIERPLSESIEDTWDLITEFMHDSNVKIARDISDEDLDYLREQFSQALDSIEDSYIFERDLRGVNYEQVAYFTEEFYNFIKNRVFNLCDPTREQGQIIEKELKEIIEESLKNAFESIQIRFIHESVTGHKDVPMAKRPPQIGEIKVALIPKKDSLIFQIVDDGKGLTEAIAKFTEVAHDDREAIPEWLGESLKRREAEGVQSLTKYSHPEVFSDKSGQGNGLLMIEHFSHERLIHGKWTLEDRMKKLGDKTGAVFTYCFNMHDSVEKKDAKTSEIRSSSASDEWEPEDFFDKLDELYVTRSWATAKRLLIKILLHYKELPNLFLGEEESVDSYFRRIASIIKARGWESNIVRIKHEFYKRGNEKAEGYASEFDRKYLSKRSRPATSPVEEDDLTDEFKIRGRSRIEFKIQPGDRMKLDDEDERVVAGKNKEGEYLIIDPENPKIQKVEIFDIHELMLGKDSTYHRPSGSDPEIETIKDYFVDESRRGTANLKYPMEDGYTAIVSLRTGEKERVNVHRFRLVEIISGPHGVDPSSLQRLILGIEKANAECEARAQSSRSTAEYIAESNFFDNEMRFMATMELAMRGYYRKAFATICSPERPHMSSDGLKYFFKKREQNEMAKDSDAVGHRVAVDKDHYHNARENMITWLKTDEKYEDILKRHFGEDEESEESPEGTLKRNPNRVKSAFKKSIKEEFDSAARSLIKSLKTTLGKLDSNWETESIEPKAEELLRRKTRYASKKELIAEFLFIIRELEAVIARPVVGKGNYLVFSKADDNRVREVCETIDAIASSAKSTTTDKPAVRIEIRIDEKSVVPPSFGADIVNDLDMIKPVLQECANYGNSLVKVLNNSIRRDLPGFLTTSPISANPEPQAGSETPPNDARASAIEKAQEFLSDGISTVMSEIDKLKGQIGPGGAGEGNADIVKAVERVECELRVAATHLATGDVVRTYNDLFYAWKDFIRLRKDLRRIDGGLLALSELEKVLREPRKLFFSIDPNLLIRTQLKMVYIHIRMEKRALTRFPRIRKSLSSMHSRLNDAISQVDYPDHPTRDFFNAGLLVHGKRLTDIIKRIEKIRHRQQAKSVIADLSNAQTELFNAHQQLMDLVDVIKENESRSSPSSASDRDPPNNTRTLAADGKPQAFRASSTRIMLTDDESVKVRSIAELRKGRIVEVKDDHPLIGDTGTYTLYAKAKPCILVLFYNRLTGRTSMIHNYDLRVVLDNIDRIEEDMGAGNNIDVICAGRSLDRSQDWDYNNDVFTMRSQVMGYLGKKGYENVKHYFPKKSNTTTHFYFDRKNKVVTIKTRKKGDQELNASLLERLRKARASAATSDDPEDPTQQLIEEISGMFDAIDAKSKKWRKKYRETEVKVRLVVASRKRLKHSLESCKQWEKLEAEYYKSLDRIQPAACVFVEWFELYKQVLHEFKNEFRRLRRLYPNRIDINRLRQIRDEMRILAHGFHRRTDSLHKAIEELYHVSSRREAFLAELGEGGPRLSPISSAVQGRHMGLPLQRVESWKDPDTLEKLIKKRIKTVRHLKRPNGVVYTVLVTGDIGPLETRGTTEALSHSYKDIFGAEIKSKLIFCSDTAEASAELSKRTDATPSNTIIYVAADVEYDGSLKEFIRTSVATSEGRSMFVVPAIEYKADAQLYTEFIRRVGILLRSMLKKSKNHSAGKLSKEIRKDSLLTSLARAMADIRSDITERYVSEEEMLDLVPGIIDMLEGNITIKQYVEKYSQQHTFNLPPGEKTDWETDMKDFLDMQRKLHEA